MPLFIARPPSAAHSMLGRYNPLEQAEPAEADEHFTANREQRPGLWRNPLPGRVTSARGGSRATRPGRLIRVETKQTFGFARMVHTYLTNDRLNCSRGARGLLAHNAARRSRFHNREGELDLVCRKRDERTIHREFDSTQNPGRGGDRGIAFCVSCYLVCRPQLE
jgi:hypothetical protein